MRTGNGKTVSLAGMLLPLLLFGVAPLSLASSGNNASRGDLGTQVRQRLATLQYYEVFDNVTFSIPAPDTVVLAGQVTRSGLKSDAEAVVRKIQGVEKVVDNIEVLPNSPADDSIRWAAFKAIFDKPSLQQYAIQTVSPLRIIVKNGEITLEGTVASQFDKTLIDMSARSVSEAAGVTDDLVVRDQSAHE
jgi:hyperosmotically inducible protein